MALRKISLVTSDGILKVQRYPGDSALQVLFKDERNEEA